MTVPEIQVRILAKEHVRYHWGWDWGPALNTSGPWKPVYLEIFEARISEFVVRQEVSEDLKSAVVKVTGSVEGGAKEVESKCIPPPRISSQARN